MFMGITKSFIVLPLALLSISDAFAETMTLYREGEEEEVYTFLDCYSSKEGFPKTSNNLVFEVSLDGTYSEKIQTPEIKFRPRLSGKSGNSMTISDGKITAGNNMGKPDIIYYSARSHNFEGSIIVDSIKSDHGGIYLKSTIYADNHVDIRHINFLDAQSIELTQSTPGIGSSAYWSLNLNYDSDNNRSILSSASKGRGSISWVPLNVKSSGLYVDTSALYVDTVRSNKASKILFQSSFFKFEGGNLEVNGTIKCKDSLKVTEVETNKIKTKDIVVDMGHAADYVFDEDYQLQPLQEVKNYVKANKHLPGIPSAAEMEKNGMSLSEMTNLLLEKVEELTLHVIRLEEENRALKAGMDTNK